MKACFRACAYRAFTGQTFCEVIKKPRWHRGPFTTSGEDAARGTGLVNDVLGIFKANARFAQCPEPLCRGIVLGARLRRDLFAVIEISPGDVSNVWTRTKIKRGLRAL